VVQSARAGRARREALAADRLEQVLQVPARFNRAQFYGGGVFHCSDNGPAGALGDDPRRVWLTLNGFFTCTRVAT
jgi:hypothetical protein